MKLKNILIPIIMIVIVVALSGCITDSIGGSAYQKNGMAFDYPGNWEEAKSVANNSMGAIVYSNDSQISIVIQQVPAEFGSTLQQAYDNNNKNLQSINGYTSIQENNTTVNGRNVTIHRYIDVNQLGQQKEHIASWMTMDDGKNYVILYSAPVEKYESQKEAYDHVVSSFKLSESKGSSFDNFINGFKGLI